MLYVMCCMFTPLNCGTPQYLTGVICFMLYYAKKQAFCLVDAQIWLRYNEKTKGRICLLKRLKSPEADKASTKAPFDN
ncbi:MAG: hypothetical protein US10_C0011G0008 [Candidatus Moranbacteria bacterium GW2011_GWD2_36_198]|nr:MAG: hypothetical protein US10_C0011G0008 [Candidatus Moranbacteria bacterium GW2011_GWD2_36_198]